MDTNERLTRILSDDFAAVDLCKEPCQTEPPGKGKTHGGEVKRKRATKKYARR